MTTVDSTDARIVVAIRHKPLHGWWYGIDISPSPCERILFAAWDRARNDVCDEWVNAQIAIATYVWHVHGAHGARMIGGGKPTGRSAYLYKQGITQDAHHAIRLLEQTIGWLKIEDRVGDSLLKALRDVLGQPSSDGGGCSYLLSVAEATIGRVVAPHLGARAHRLIGRALVLASNEESDALTAELERALSAAMSPNARNV